MCAQVFSRVDHASADQVGRYGAGVPDYSRFIKQQVSSRLHHPGGRVETTRDPAVWTLAHRGYSGSGRLDVWVYATKQEALREGAKPAMACGMEEDDQARQDYDSGRWQKVMDAYEETHTPTPTCSASRAPSCSSPGNPRHRERERVVTCDVRDGQAPAV